MKIIKLKDIAFDADQFVGARALEGGYWRTEICLWFKTTLQTTASLDEVYEAVEEAINPYEESEE